MIYKRGDIVEICDPKMEVRYIVFSTKDTGAYNSLSGEWQPDGGQEVTARRII